MYKQSIVEFKCCINKVLLSSDVVQCTSRDTKLYININIRHPRKIFFPSVVKTAKNCQRTMPHGEKLHHCVLQEGTRAKTESEVASARRLYWSS